MFDRALRLLREPVRWVPWVLAALPALWMAWFVLQGSQLQYSDYWDMMPRTVTPSGGIDLGGLTTFQNEHPVVIPQFLFWVNVHLTAGSNIALGLFVVAVVFAQVVLIGRFVEPADRRKWAAGSVVVVASVLLFSRQGVHNFSKSMSGTAWLTTNLFVVAAIFARFKDRTWLSAALGVAASITYATGLVVWPVLIIVGLLRDRRWLPDWRIVVAAVFPIVFYLVRRPDRVGAFQVGPRELIKGALAIGGSIFTESLSVMRVTTGLGALLGVGLIAVAVWKRNAAAVPWIGLLVYGGACLALISRGRLLFVRDTWFQSRYASLAALFWIGLFGLAAVVLRWKWVVFLPAAALVVAAVTFNTPAVDEERQWWLKQDDLAAGLVLGLADDRSYAYAILGTLDVGPLLEQLGNYPFTDSYDADCGRLGTTYDADSIGNASSGRIESVRRMTKSEGIRIIAELPDETEAPIDCVVVGDADDEVVGIGTVGLGEQRTFVGMSTSSTDPGRLAAIAPIGSSEYKVLLVLSDGSLLQLGEPIVETDIKGR
jgi:hypothetical protein